MMQRSAVIVKPDGIQRGLVGEIISRFEHKGLKLAGMKMTQLTPEILDIWYAHHKTKPFFADLKSFMTQTPVVCMVWEGLDAVSTIRKLVGSTKGREAEAGSIRGDLAMSQSNNLIHASDSVENGEKEVSLLFQPEEMFEYASGTDCLIYSGEERR